MKLYPLLLTLFLHSTNTWGDSSIDTEIEQIMNAPAHERVERINQFKAHLATMNELEQSEALEKLQNNKGRGRGMERSSSINFNNVGQRHPPSFNQGRGFRGR